MTGRKSTSRENNSFAILNRFALKLSPVEYCPSFLIISIRMFINSSLSFLHEAILSLIRSEASLKSRFLTLCVGNFIFR